MILCIISAKQKNESGGLIYVGEKEYRSAVRSRELIREAMLDLICEKKLNDITIKEVVSRARINRSTFYAHYSNLGDLVEELEAELLTQMVEQLNSREDPSISPEMVARHIIKLFDSYPQYIKGKSNNSSFTEILQRVIGQYLDLCLQEASLSQREDPSFKTRLQLVMMFVFYGITNCNSGEWSLKMTYPQTVEELINICRKL